MSLLLRSKAERAVFNSKSHFFSMVLEAAHSSPSCGLCARPPDNFHLVVLYMSRAVFQIQSACRRGPMIPGCSVGTSSLGLQAEPMLGVSFMAALPYVRVLMSGCLPDLGLTKCLTRLFKILVDVWIGSLVVAIVS